MCVCVGRTRTKWTDNDDVYLLLDGMQRTAFQNGTFGWAFFFSVYFSFGLTFLSCSVWQMDLGKRFLCSTGCPVLFRGILFVCDARLLDSPNSPGRGITHDNATLVGGGEVILSVKHIILHFVGRGLSCHA